MSNSGAPAVSIAIHTPRWSYRKAYGTSNVENNVPATEQTVFRYASVTKAITATAVMQMVEAGKIDLEHPIQEYCPEFPAKQWPVTVRNVLAFTSGIRHYRDDEEGLTSAKHFNSVVESLVLFKDDPLLFKPGTKFGYSTYAYSLLACAVEHASGEPFGAYLDHHIFTPAGMTTATIDDALAIIPHRASGYQKSSTGVLQNATLLDTSGRTAGGGVAGTGEDLASFGSSVLSYKLLSQATQKSMWLFQPLQLGTTPLGLGWGILMHDGKLHAVFIGGGQPGTSSFLLIDLKTGSVISVLANLLNADTQSLAFEIQRLLDPANPVAADIPK
jgi:CubicO group peptidase (beta-lactamase class C family)